MGGGRREGGSAGGDDESERERERALRTRAGARRGAPIKKTGVLPRTPLAGYYFFYY